MLPARRRRPGRFGEALFDFNARAPGAFAAVQGGVYSSPVVAEMVRLCRGLGMRGVGQSSWGPSVFAVTEADRAEELARVVQQRFGPASIVLTRACNHGASVEVVEA
jgi:predicted sugar kinase